MSNSLARIVVCLATTSGLALFAGCKVGPNFKAPERPMPQGWTSALAPPTTQPSTLPSGIDVPTTQASSANTDAPLVELWWRTFNDPTLDSLIDRAVQSNLDVRIAATRIRQARASRQITAAGFWPNVDTTASYTRSGTGRRGTGRSNSSSLHRAGLDASWELDIFGGVQRDIEAADADIESSIEDRRDVLVTLTSEVALNYLDLRGFQSQLDIANRNLGTQRKSLDISRRKRAAGLVGGLDVANAEAQVASTLSQIPAIEQALQQTIYNIALLLAQEPGALVDELSPVGPIPKVPASVPIGLPSELLRRRPDIRRAEADLHAATARIGVAEADLFPRFTLGASLGTSGRKFNDLFNWGNRLWSFGPAVSYPLFDAGRIRANIELQNAAQEQLLISYERTVLTALRDVDVALVAYTQEQRRHAALIDTVSASRRSVDLSTRLYSEGATDFLNVLTAQRALFSSEDALAQSDRTIATNLIALYKALGGGWEVGEPPAPKPAPAPAKDPK